MTYTRNTYDETNRQIDNTADQAHSTIDKAQQVAADVKNRAADLADDAKIRAMEAADRVDAATTTAGAKMTDVAQTLREKAPASGPAADVAVKAANTLESAGTYLQRQDLDGMRTDIESIIRRRPVESMLVGLGIGYLLARSTRR